MKYKFTIQNGQLRAGSAILDIRDSVADVDPADDRQVKLAEKHGGKPVTRRRKAKEKGQ